MPGLWVTENEIGFPAMTLPVKKLLYSGETPFQKIDLYETELLGKLLMLDESSSWQVSMSSPTTK